MLGALFARFGRRPPAPADPSALVARRAVDRASRAPAAALTLLDLSEGPDPEADAVWRRTIRTRIVVLLVILGGWSVAIEARLLYLQVVRHDHYLARAEQQQQGVVDLPATRGDIVDRHGRILAYSAEAEAIVAHPSLIADAPDVVAQLCAALGDCSADERARLSKTFAGRSHFTYVRRSRSVMPDQAARVAALGLPGIRTQVESRRWYPNREMASHVLGFVGLDDAGLSGIEAAFDTSIRGREGVLLVQKDGSQQFMNARVSQAPTAGITLELTIDVALQHVVERELARGVQEARAVGGTAIVMDPHTGEVLALANEPTFNPNDFRQYPQDSWKNRAVQDVYEPGSTFKIVTAAAAIDEGVVSPSDVINTSPGYITFPGRKPIHDVTYYSSLTFEDVIVKSSNVGAIRVGLEVGADRMSRFIRRFGLGQILEPHLPGQSGGIVHPPNDLDASGLASVSMGYQISVTPLQMATVASVIANGGTLMEPRLVRAIVRDGVREVVAPKALRQAVKPATAATVRTFMEGVVERGTGTRARLSRYQVAGKSGTAKKVVDGRYADNEYNASFVGFAPSGQPVFTILVVIDTPRGHSYYGGAVAAPVFARIAEAALHLAGVPPTLNRRPPAILATTREARMAEALPVIELVPVLASAGGARLMPDLRGLGARDAVRVLIDLGLTPRVAGAGVVTTQYPEPGAAITDGGWGAVRLSREPPPADVPTSGGGR
ncbi:MAG TPA: penicillin-binding protein [Vicinamibacterales bacterium]|nr:penicillin-binding protein [Vicinamibacterales bacterium]